MNNKPNFEEILKQSGGKIDRNTLENAAKTGNTDALLGSLSTSDKQKLNDILNNKQELEKVLKSPQARLLFKMLGGEKNG